MWKGGVLSVVLLVCHIRASHLRCEVVDALPINASPARFISNVLSGLACVVYRINIRATGNEPVNNSFNVLCLLASMSYVETEMQRGITEVVSCINVCSGTNQGINCLIIISCGEVTVNVVRRI